MSVLLPTRQEFFLYQHLDTGELWSRFLRLKVSVHISVVYGESVVSENKYEHFELVFVTLAKKNFAQCRFYAIDFVWYLKLSMGIYKENWANQNIKDVEIYNNKNRHKWVKVNNLRKAIIRKCHSNQLENTITKKIDITYFLIIVFLYKIDDLRGSFRSRTN